MDPGVAGLACAGAMMGLDYASPKFMEWMHKVLGIIRDHCYAASADLQMRREVSINTKKKCTLKATSIRPFLIGSKEKIVKQGLRNSHLLSIAPTGTISLVADNVSSGIEPPFSLYYDRTIQHFEGSKVERVEDYAYRQGYVGKTANEITAQDHVRVLACASAYVDSAVSKTCNVGDDVPYEEFKTLYENAWALGCKGITTFRVCWKEIWRFERSKKKSQKAELATSIPQPDKRCA